MVVFDVYRFIFTGCFLVAYPGTSGRLFREQHPHKGSGILKLCSRIQPGLQEPDSAAFTPVQSEQVQNHSALYRFADPSDFFQIRLRHLTVNDHGCRVLHLPDSNANHVQKPIAAPVPHGAPEEYTRGKPLMAIYK
jgi:hypothetical protein